MRSLFLSLLSSTVLISSAGATEIYPLDKATVLMHSPFDFKVELDKLHKAEDISVRLNGQDYKAVFGKAADFIAVEKDQKGNDSGSALLLRHVSMEKPGRYEVVVKAGDEQKTVYWDVYGASETPKVKNVIFLLGDGLSVAHRTSARIMSKGMSVGKADGRLNMDDLDHMAFIGTSSTNAIATDSANTMSAYMTGHKTAVNAIGVYADRTADSLDDPRVENLGEALRRTTNKALGIVTTSELEDATPAAIVSHTRNRYDKAEIVGMISDLKPEVVLGGGSAYFLPKSVNGSKRKDDIDYIKAFRDQGYQLVTTASELEQIKDGQPVLGLFHTGNLDTVLDRKQLKKGTVEKFPNQPGLVDMTRAALKQLSKNENGFFLMVEGASIDKMSHPMDWDRAIFETIEFDQAIGVAMEFAKEHPDTLIVVTGDHTHGVSLLGTVDDTIESAEMREKVGVYQYAGFPNYEDKDGDGYPDRVDVSRRLMLFANNFPDYYETFRPKLDGPFVPAIKDENKNYIANPAYKDVPGAVLRVGNIPHSNDTAVHAVDDVVLQSTGPMSENFKGYMEQSDVYRVLADALGFGKKTKK